MRWAICRYWLIELNASWLTILSVKCKARAPSALQFECISRQLIVDWILLLLFCCCSCSASTTNLVVFFFHKPSCIRKYCAHTHTHVANISDIISLILIEIEGLTMQNYGNACDGACETCSFMHNDMVRKYIGRLPNQMTFQLACIYS